MLAKDKDSTAKTTTAGDSVAAILDAFDDLSLADTAPLNK